MEPELSRDIGMAVLFPENRSMRDPYKLVVALADQFTAQGGRIERARLRALPGPMPCARSS
ncbi:hypothetical protein ACFSHQ_00350 [Gemmobacter lanyuensis]